MPSVNLQILPLGPVIDVAIHISTPRKEALQSVQATIPPPVRARLLIDTGASNTSIDEDLITQLQLTPTGSIPIQTPSTTAANPHICNQYDVSVIIPHAQMIRHFHAVAVIGSKFSHQGIHGLLGRDILSECLFIYNGELGIYTLSF